MFGYLALIAGVALTVPGCERIQGGAKFDPSAFGGWATLGPGLVAGGLYWIWPRKADCG